jgi:hypothetical protein
MESLYYFYLTNDLDYLLSLLKCVLLPDKRSMSSIASIEAMGALPLNKETTIKHQNVNHQSFRLHTRTFVPKIVSLILPKTKKADLAKEKISQRGMGD